MDKYLAEATKELNDLIDLTPTKEEVETAIEEFNSEFPEIAKIAHQGEIELEYQYHAKRWAEEQAPTFAFMYAVSTLGIGSQLALAGVVMATPVGAAIGVGMMAGGAAGTVAVGVHQVVSWWRNRK